MDGDEWLASYRHRLADVAARAAGAGAALAGVEGTATSPDGAVTATVGPAGALLRLVLSERSADLTRAQLAAAVVATAREAHGEAARRATEAVEPLVGGQSAAMRVLRDHLPDGAGTR